jgi:hypothetical protein
MLLTSGDVVVSSHNTGDDVRVAVTVDAPHAEAAWANDWLRTDTDGAMRSNAVSRARSRRTRCVVSPLVLKGRLPSSPSGGRLQPIDRGRRGAYG